MLIKNCNLLNDEFKFVRRDMRVEEGCISDIRPLIPPNEGEEILDANYNYVIPGLIDIHIHGAMGHDVCDNNYDGLCVIADYLADNGITSFLPTTLTLSEKMLTDVGQTVNRFKNTQKSGAYAQGIYMEGPFFSMAKKGAQNGDYIMNPDFDMFMRIYEAGGKSIKVVAVAPELPGAREFIEKASSIATVSIGHTDGTHDSTKNALEWGASHCTHLYNGMPSFSHRDPSVVGTILDSSATTELICDGFHVHPTVIRNTYRLVGEDRLVLISDAIKPCGMPNGQYELGGLDVFMKDGKALLENGTIAGNTTNLMGCVKLVCELDIPLEKAVKAASLNPARVIGVDKECGSLSVGKFADIVILNNDLSVKKVFIKGQAHV